MSDVIPLNDLRRLDPETYNEIISVFELAGYRQPRNQALDYLQGCIQRAIAKRCWAYQVSCTFQGTPFGKIITKNADGTTWFHQDRCGDSPAQALLTAYLEALEGR